MLWEFEEAVVVDVETTGLNANTDRVVSVAAIRAKFSDLHVNQKVLSSDAFIELIDPQRNIPIGTTKVHGISNEDVRGKPIFQEIAHDLRNFVGERPIIAHNASFDKRFLDAEFKRSGVRSLRTNGRYCTMKRYQRFTGRRQGSKLDDVVASLGLGARKGKVHGALEDAELALKIASHFYMEDRLKGLKIATNPISKLESDRLQPRPTGVKEIRCRKCGQRLRIPIGRKLKITCPKCDNSWIYGEL